MQKARGAATKAEKDVRTAAKKAAKGREQAKQNPALTCFALLGELGEEFYETYGTNGNDANAFGKCVSEHARSQGEDAGEAEQDVAEDSAQCEEPVEVDDPMEDDEPAGDPIAELTSLDADPPAEDGCDPGADGEEGDPAEDGEPEEGDAEPELTCFVPAAARANPFAVCVRV